MKIGVALHLGEVMYGNIGARERLDFTGVGGAVNEACRVEALCKELQVPLLLSARFAAALAESAQTSVVSAGGHELRGVREPQELFTLSRYRR